LNCSYSSFTSAVLISLSTNIRPQYSQTIIFFFFWISNCLWGGILLKQPPQASLSTETTASPLRALPLILLYAVRSLGSIIFCISEDLLNKVSSSFLVSETISSSSFFLLSRSSFLSVKTSFDSIICSFLKLRSELNSDIFFLDSSISRF